MTGWLIAAGICLILLLLLFLPMSVQLIYREKMTVYLGVLFLRFRLYPKKKKQPKPRDFTVSALKKRYRKLLRKKRAVNAGASRKTAQKQKAKTDPQALLRFTMRLLYTVLGRFGKYFRIHIRDLTVRLATEDAAKTAIAYGAVSAAMNQFFAALCATGTVRKKEKKHIRLIADFSGRKAGCSCYIIATTNVLRALRFIMRGGIVYLTGRSQREQTETAAQKKSRLANETHARAEILHDIGK